MNVAGQHQIVSVFVNSSSLTRGVPCFVVDFCSVDFLEMFVRAGFMPRSAAKTRCML